MLKNSEGSFLNKVNKPMLNINFNRNNRKDFIYILCEI